jgi:transglutaminase-like putative cysteine protease
MRRVLTLMAVLAIATPAFADVDPRITDAIAKVKSADFPSANVVTVIGDQAVVYQTDGQFTNTQHIARMALTTAGKSEVASSSFYYTKDAEKMEVLSAQVIKKDGKVVPVDKKDIQDTEQSGEMNIYDPNGRAVKVTFSNIAVGDVVEITARLTRLTPTRVGFFNDIFGFQSTEPMLSATYSVDGPAKLPLTSEIYHRERATKITETKSPAGDRIHYAWSVQRAPQLVPEAAMDFSTEVPMLVVTTDPSWQHFSKWWADLTAPQLVASAEMKAKVKELTKDAKTDEDKIKALYDFVAQDIRYRGLGVGPRTGYTPRKAEETFTSRWGVCRDVSILLTSMLRESGLEAYPVLTNVGDPVLPKLAYDGFNHAIVAMPKAGGGWRYLDPTAKNNTSLLPGYEAEQDTLVSTSKGEGLSRIPAVEPAANLGHAIAQTTIRPDGSMTSTVKLETKGMFDLVLRSGAAMMSEDQMHDAIEELLHHSLPDAKLLSVKMSSAMKLFEPMTLTVEIEVPNAAPKTGDYRLARTLVTSGALGLVENFLPEVLGALPTRKYGLDAHVTFEYDEDETVTLPADVKLVALPSSAKVSSKVSEVVAECAKQSPTQMSCHRSFQLKTRFVDPEQYKALRGALAALGQIARQPVILAGAK